MMAVEVVVVVVVVGSDGFSSLYFRVMNSIKYKYRADRKPEQCGKLIEEDAKFWILAQHVRADVPYH